MEHSIYKKMKQNRLKSMYL